jgi:exopolysaccharide biosynthesis protein
VKFAFDERQMAGRGGRSVMTKHRFSSALLAAALGWSGPAVLSAADTESLPFPGVRYVHRQTAEPRVVSMHVVLVDLNLPGVKITTTGPNDDPETDSDFETTRQFVRRTGARLGLNGGFFGYTRGAVATGRGDLVSLAVSDGRMVRGWGGGQHDAFNIGPDNTVCFVRRASPDETGAATDPPVELHHAMAGNVRLIEDGVVLARGGDPTYPQTAVGRTADNHLILFVSDGRQPGFSEGMTYGEVAEVLRGFGAVDAIALDGGGSATMVLADGGNGEPRVVNRPSDGTERAVGNNLGVMIAEEK